MFVKTIAWFSLVCSYQLSIYGAPKDYIQRRRDILTKEARWRVGGHLKLTPDEAKVNEILMHEKWKEINKTLFEGAVFPPAVNFIVSKPTYESSRVFQILRKMPKGAILHLHEMAAVPLDWVVKNVTYRPNCFMCTDKEGALLFRFFRIPPTNPDCKWERVSEVRKSSNNITAFDNSIYNSMSLIVPDPDVAYPTNRDAWIKFKQTIKTSFGLGSFTGIIKDRLRETLAHAQNDNVMYIEVRGLYTAYDLDGVTYDREWSLKTFEEVVAEFQKDYPDFIGGKYIITALRTNTNEKMRDEIKETLRLRQKYPDIIAGFDLCFDEDRGRPTGDFVDDLLYPSTLQPPVDLPYYLHAGETDWTGTEVDANLLDAILVGTKRIGHGFALHGHPELLRLIKEKDIAIEVNPISNQVLSLIRDLRVHPAVSLLAQNYPVVIGSDDPGLFDSLPASFDYYAAFMALGGADADLRFLKQLVINSFIYSSMKEEQKQRALSLWKLRWDKFVSDIVSTQWADYKSNNVVNRSWEHSRFTEL